MKYSPREYELNKEYRSRIVSDVDRVNLVNEMIMQRRSSNILSTLLHPRYVLVIAIAILIMVFAATQTQAQEGFSPGEPILSPREAQLVYLRWGLDSYIAGDVGEALNLIHDSMTFDETFALPFVVRSLILTSEGDVEAGLADALIALELQPETEVGHFALAWGYEGLGQFELASFHYYQYVLMLELTDSIGYRLVDSFTKGSSINAALERAESSRQKLFSRSEPA